MKTEDGRHARSERSKRQLIDALIGLVSEGNFSPTSNQVSERAQLSQRTLFIRFKTFNGLYEDAIRSLPASDPVRHRLEMAHTPDRSLERLEELECRLGRVQAEIESAINWIATGADPVVALEGVQRALSEAAAQTGVTSPGLGETIDPIGA